MVRGFITVLIFVFISSNLCFADETAMLTEGIESYKSRNYEQCITTMKNVVKNDPTSALGYYYLGLSYAKTGKTILAVRNYDKVIALGSDKTLIDLAHKGKACAGGKNITAIEVQLNDIEEEIKENTTYKKPEKPSKEEIKQKDEDKNTKQTLKDNNENSSGSTIIRASEYAKQNAQPTNDEIVNAIRVLQKAGLLQNGAAGLSNMVPQQMDAKTQQMNAMIMMMGQNGNNNNGMMNMMPLMNNGKGNVNPQMLQMMMMNQMMPNFSTGNGNGY